MVERLLLSCVIAAAGVLPLAACSSQSKPQPGADGSAPPDAERPRLLTMQGDRPIDAATPSDFWISLTVAGPSRAGGVSATPRAMRPARYVMEPDRQLRAAVGLGASEASFPPALRRLSDEQVARLWRIVDAAGFMGPDHASRAKGMIVFETLPEKTMYALNIFAQGERRQLLIDGEDPAAPGRDAARRLADTLAELSWLDEPPQPDGGSGMPQSR